MKHYIILIFILLSTTNLFGEEVLNLEDILKRLEARYDVSGFSAKFNQESTIKSMDVTDTAMGKVFFKRPNMMRWDYEKPEKQNLIANGINLWIYKPEDNQVSVGKAPAFFRDGKGASFLTDIKQIRKKFNIKLDAPYYLKLLPIEKMSDISMIYLKISPTDFNVIEVISYNTYGDITKIKLSEIKFEEMNNSMFNFTIPKGVDILELGDE
ncbi:MAG: outer membrane lipoprotein chaperone LolA [Desulfobacterales bacterium]|nr:outer membrane lipoprotein chaperone LolA [Desulfobacterales bacterium]MBF0397280.1 outer membrane lipoprotein chaperone LolA [Desulfobacterales bacterium]